MNQRLVAAAGIMALLPWLSQSAALAESTAPPAPAAGATTTIQLDSQDSGIIAESLVVTFPGTLSAAKVADIKQQLQTAMQAAEVPSTPLPGASAAASAASASQRLSNSSEATAAAAAAATTPYLYCNGKGYTFSDADGLYHTQRACGASIAPWYYQISPALCAAAVGTVAEHGMVWTHNGVAGTRQAAHPTVPCTYTIHGSYNPVLASKSTAMTYIDLIDLVLNVGGTVGSARITFHGAYTYGAYPCSPTSC